MSHIEFTFEAVTIVLLIAWFMCRFVTLQASRDLVWRTALVFVVLTPGLSIVRGTLLPWQYQIPILPAANFVTTHSKEEPGQTNGSSGRSSSVVEAAVDSPRALDLGTHYDRVASSGGLEEAVETVESVESVAGAPIATVPGFTELPTAVAGQPWLALAGSVWLIGFLIQCVRIGRGGWNACCLVSSANRVTDKSRTELNDWSAKKVGLTVPAVLLTSSRIDIPIVSGVMCPRIIVPTCLLTDDATPLLRAALLHECGHIRRHDLAFDVLLKVAVGIFWPHPLVHVMAAELRRLREEICDNYVLAEESAVAYSEMLLHFAIGSRWKHGLRAGLGMFEQANRLEARVASLLAPNRSLETRPHMGTRRLLLAATWIVLLASIFIRFERVAASPPAPSPPAPNQANTGPREDGPADKSASPISQKAEAPFQDPSREFQSAVQTAIERGRSFIVSQQSADGSWGVEQDELRTGATSLALLALLNSGMSPQDVHVSRGLQYLRSLKNETASGQHETYRVSLMIMALAAARTGETDLERIRELARRLERGQLQQGTPGGWTYSLSGGATGDSSNSQFAVQGLRDAVDSGAIVSRETWQRARDYWERAQNRNDGGWGYMTDGDRSYGSMTVAGICSLAICEQMLRSDEGVSADGLPPCCDPFEPNAPLVRGIDWLGKHFAVGKNPGASAWALSYTHGIERAGRLTGRRFFGDHDWYLEGVHSLMAMQNAKTGHWTGTGHVEDQPVVGTSLALLFLSKGRAPVLINKLKYGPRNPTTPGDVLGNEWNRHRSDVRNLTELIRGLPKWPNLLTSQEVDLARAVKSGDANALLKAPVLFVTGEKPPVFSAEELKLLKGYLRDGGFIFACPTCKSPDFENGFRAVVEQLTDKKELGRLPADHPVYRSEYVLDAKTTPLLGVEVGGRTSIVYSTEDLGCLWDYWTRQDPPNRNENLKSKIIRATQIGVNVIAYATRH